MRTIDQIKEKVRTTADREGQAILERYQVKVRSLKRHAIDKNGDLLDYSNIRKEGHKHVDEVFGKVKEDNQMTMELNDVLVELVFTLFNKEMADRIIMNNLDSGILKEIEKEDITTQKERIVDSFSWRRSKEGYDFWCDFYDTIRVPEEYITKPVEHLVEPTIEDSLVNVFCGGCTFYNPDNVFSKCSASEEQRDSCHSTNKVWKV